MTGFNLPILDADLDAAKKLFDVNFWGVIATVQTFAPLLISAEGTIVIIGSCGGILPYPFAGIPSSHWICFTCQISNLCDRYIRCFKVRSDVHRRRPQIRNVSLQRQSTEHLYRRCKISHAHQHHQKFRSLHSTQFSLSSHRRHGSTCTRWQNREIHGHKGIYQICC